MSNKVEYRTFETANNVNAILKTTFKADRKLWRSLKGKYSDEEGFEMAYDISNSYSESNLGPLVKSNVTATNINWTGDVSKVKIRRINGPLYYIQIWLCIIIASIIFLSSLIKYFETGEFQKNEFHIILLICVIYALLIELWSINAFNKLTHEIIDLLNNNGVETEKL